MYALDFDNDDLAAGPMPDHAVTRLGFGILVTCPVAPTDPQQPYMGRCSTCGTRLSGRTYPDPSQVIT